MNKNSEIESFITERPVSLLALQLLMPAVHDAEQATSFIQPGHRRPKDLPAPHELDESYLQM